MSADPDHPLLEQIDAIAAPLEAESKDLIDRLEEVQTELTALGEARAVLVKGLIGKVKRERAKVPPASESKPGGGKPAQPPSAGKPPSTEREIKGADVRKAVEDLGEPCSIDQILAELGAPKAQRPRVHYHVQRLVKADVLAAEGKTSNRRFTIAEETDAPPPSPPAPPDPGPADGGARSDGLEKPPAPPPPGAPRIELLEGDYDIADVLRSSSAPALTAAGIALKLKIPVASVAPRLEALLNAGYLQRGLNGSEPVFGIGRRALPSR